MQKEEERACVSQGSVGDQNGEGVCVPVYTHACMCVCVHVQVCVHVCMNVRVRGGRVSFLVLFGPLTDWARITHIREKNLLYSVYPSLLSSGNFLPDTFRTMCDLKHGHVWPSQANTLNPPTTPGPEVRTEIEENV